MVIMEEDGCWYDAQLEPLLLEATMDPGNKKHEFDNSALAPSPSLLGQASKDKQLVDVHLDESSWVILSDLESLTEFKDETWDLVDDAVDLCSLSDTSQPSEEAPIDPSDSHLETNSTRALQVNKQSLIQGLSAMVWGSGEDEVLFNEMTTKMFDDESQRHWTGLRHSMSAEDWLDLFDSLKPDSDAHEMGSNSIDDTTNWDS
ncbi:hypothetical protein BGZ63DRAFT_398675 [Mariannaea sp. PMI_226]|nr:hypothetical protein BGZ63DRAFT_398675 [Mariannaea sp. PMI_226]